MVNPWQKCDAYLCFRVCQRFGHKVPEGETCPRCLHKVGDNSFLALVNAVVSRHVVHTFIDYVMQPDPMLLWLKQHKR